MEYTCKMILQTLLLSMAVMPICQSSPQRFRIPNLNFSPPEEVNSLERELPIVSRSIDHKSGPSNNIDDTIREVEDIIKSNPELPRLTRGEIMDLLENITNVDAGKANVPLRNKNRDPKALMVVMPYTPNDDKNMQDLYTKPPVTQIIGETFKTKEEPKHSRRRPPVRYIDSEEDNNLTQKFSEDFRRDTTTFKPETTTSISRNQLRRRRPERTTTVKTGYTPATTYRPRNRRPIRQRSTTTTTTTTIAPPTRHPNHRYPGEDVEVTTRRGNFVPSDGIRIIDSPRLTQFGEDMRLEETRQDPLLSQEIFSKSQENEDSNSEEIEQQEIVYIPPEIAAVTTRRPFRRSTTPKTIIEQMSLPENLRSFVKDLNLEHPEQSSSEEKKSIKEMLASIGAIHQTSTTTTSTAIPDVAYVANALTPEMRDLLKSFGLLPDANATPSSTNNDKYIPDKAEVKAESYVGFKPLPDDQPSRNDMDVLLASFGLGRNARRQKSLNANREKQINFDVVPDDFKPIIDQIGLRDSKNIRTTLVQSPTPQRQIQQEQRNPNNKHVFNPDNQYATEEELKKLDKLLGMIKQLEKLNGSATDDDLKKIDMDSLKELVGSLNGGIPPSDSLVTLDQNKNSPDPNDFDVGLVKNEVKRQENSTSSSTTEKSPSVSDLEASFGGKVEVATEEALPETTTARRNGFYYLVDWNTFLDIDDQKGKRVNLRFQPKVGDPKRFLSVSVP